MKSSLWNNVIFTMIFSSFIFITEQIYRLYMSSLHFLSLSSLVEIFIVFFILSLIKNNKIACCFILLTIIAFIVQLIHYIFFGSWVSSYEIYMSFSNVNEIKEALFNGSYYVVLCASIGFVLLLSLVLFVDRNNASRKKSKLALPLLLLIFSFAIIKPAFLHSEMGRFPIDKYSAVRNLYLTSFYFLGRELPDALLNKTEMKNWSHPPYTLINKQKEKSHNVIFIIGESLSSNRMSALGYSGAETTPYLSTLKNSPQFFLGKGISSSVVTSVSLPSLLNIIQKPNALPQIIKETTNLFLMAKQQGYKTFFVSAQSREDLKVITNHLGFNAVDFFAIKDKSLYDNYLVEELKSLDVSAKNFIVLHMRGSHYPYVTRYPSSFIKKNKNISVNYDNSVKYTDHIIKEIISVLHKKFNDDFEVVFTSDHGEGISAESSTMHGNVKNPSHYQVPIMLYSADKNHASLFNDLKAHLTQNTIASHYQLMQVIARLLGYNALEDNTKNTYYINGSDLIGNAGMVKMDFKNGHKINSEFLIKENE